MRYFPPDDHVILNVDSSQIEGSYISVACGVKRCVEQFRKEKEDVYSNFIKSI